MKELRRMTVSELEGTLVKAAGVLVLIAALVGWLAVAQHPTARNVKKALLLTLNGL